MGVVALIPIEWGQGMEEILSPAASPDDLAALRSEVVGGFASLWCVAGKGFCITRFETSDSGTELVLVAGVGRDYKEVVRGFQHFAKTNNYTLRAHTTRKGIGRFLLSLGFSLAGYDQDGFAFYRWGNHGREK